MSAVAWRPPAVRLHAMILKAPGRRADAIGMCEARRSEAGMTLVEVMVAALILVVGMGGTLTLVDTANKTADANNARVTALNLGREVFEDARSVDYDLLTPSGVAPALQARPGLAGSGNPWSIVRRGVTYSLDVKACTFDDPKDGLANGTTVTPPADECLPRAAAAAGTRMESNPDDFRRVDVEVAWNFHGSRQSIELTDVIVNPAGGLGPRIKSITEPPAQITTGTSVSIPVTTTYADTLHWLVDVGSTEGEAVGGPLSWTIQWPIGTVGGTGSVLDGTYSINAQPFDTRGVPGDTRTAIVQLNRSLPFAPTGLIGGRNNSQGRKAVDLEWGGNRERDILGYRVYRDGVLVCGTIAKPLNAFNCTDDPVPSSGTLTYTLYAIDRADLANTNSALRQGAASRPLAITGIGPAPVPPTGLSASVVNNLAHLTWTAPPSGTVAFYRIYRDGTELINRVARTASKAVFFDDVEWGGTGHTYRVTAVDPSFNESDLSNAAVLVAP